MYENLVHLFCIKKKKKKIYIHGVAVSNLKLFCFQTGVWPLGHSGDQKHKVISSAGLCSEYVFVWRFIFDWRGGVFAASLCSPNGKQSPKCKNNSDD